MAPTSRPGGEPMGARHGSCDRRGGGRRDRRGPALRRGTWAPTRLAGFEVLDPLPAWQEEITPEEIRIPGDNLHYNRGGNALFGETIAEAIRELD